MVFRIQSYADAKTCNYSQPITMVYLSMWRYDRPWGCLLLFETRLGCRLPVCLWELCNEDEEDDVRDCKKRELRL